MKHRVAGRKLGRTSAHRLALLRNLSTELFDKERIRTTLGKAKEVRPFAEHLLTLAKRETLHARRLVLRHVHDKEVVAKLFDALSARYAQRPGGYTRIIKLGPRRGDNAEMALIELVGAETAAKAEPVDEKPAKKGKAAKATPSDEAPAKAKAKAAPKAKAKPKAEPKAKPKAKAKTKTATTSKAKGGSKSTTPRKAGGS